MLRKYIVPPLICLMLVLAVTAGCSQPAPQQPAAPAAPAPAPAPPAKDKIVVGSVHSISGPLAIVEGAAFGPIRKMWIDEVNARGGIFVKEYGKKLPLELIEYDDRSDIGTMARLLEKLILEDKVDLLLPPTGTAMLYAAGPVANKHKYILPGMSGGAASIKEIISGLPYFFSNLNFAETQLPAFADMCADLGVKSAAVVFIGDLHGVEYSGAAVPELALRGIEIAFVKSIPPGIKDISSILKEAQSANVDAFLCLAYPDENILAVSQSMEIGFNPKIFVTGPGGNFGFFKEIFGPKIEGLMSWGAWNAQTSPGAQEFLEKFLKIYPEAAVDYWGHLIYWGALQFLEQAIEKAGTLDQSVIREIMATEKFETVLGPTWYENQLLAIECHPGEVGQWQNGKFEVVAPKDKATAAPVYPKPKW